MVISSLCATLVVATILRSQPGPVHLAAPVSIPFMLVKNHIVLPVSVDGKGPFAFVLDTGNKYTAIDIDKARALGLSFGREVTVGGVGSSTSKGAFVDGSSVTIAGLEAHPQPLSLALPLAPLAARLGREFDGILGEDFIRLFVVEIDYKQRLVRLHDARSFVYSGAGEAIPIRFDAGHPIVRATIRPVGGTPIEGEFKLDIGAEALTLHAPFVEEHDLPGNSVTTVRSLGSLGAGGASVGRVGRLGSIRIGRFELRDPIAVFSRDRSGAFANAGLQGNLGATIVRNHRLFLDYGRKRIILEPNPAFPASGDRAFSGLSLEAVGPGFTAIRVADVLEDSPASDAGFRPGDVIESVDGKSAASMTLSDVLEQFERVTSFEIVARRAGDTVRLTLTTRRFP